MRFIAVAALMLTAAYMLGRDGDGDAGEVWAIAHAEQHIKQQNLSLSGVSVARRDTEAADMWLVAGQARRRLDGEVKRWQLKVHLLCNGAQAECAQVEPVSVRW